LSTRPTLRTKRKEGKNSLHLEKALEKLEFFLSSRPLRSQKELRSLRNTPRDCRLKTIEEILQKEDLREGKITYLGEALHADLIDQLNETEYPVRLFRSMAAYLRVVDRNGAGKLLRYAADKGNKIDEYNYCDFCLETGVNIEFYKGYLNRAAEKGHRRAQYELGMCYLKGLDVEKDEIKAFEWIQKAAEEGHAVAGYHLGMCFFYGAGVEKDEGKGFKWIQKAAEQGYAVVQYYLGIGYFSDYGMAKDKLKAFEWIQKAAKQGHKKAQYEVGLGYLEGLYVEKDEVKSFGWMKKAAKQGHAKAQYMVGKCYLEGRGVEKGGAESFGWMEKAAEKGHAEAQFQTGLFYFRSGWEIGKITAFGWMEKAALQGHREAQGHLGMFYFNGVGVEKDEGKAFEWTHKSAEGGELQAHYNLGLCYFHGWGTKQNLEKAAAHVQPIPLKTRKEHGIARGIQDTDPFYLWVMSVPFKEGSLEERREDSEKEKEI
jgi:TPR repeat protein